MWAGLVYDLSTKIHLSRGFTILESESGSLFLDTAISVDSGRETGILLISNSDGSSYSISLQHTNRNHRGDVDFEKMLGIDGVFVANQITNPNEVTRGDQKHLRTMMSYDDGATWKTLSAPPVDALGDRYACADKPDECQLHLHLYTERDRVKNEISDSGAVGVMVGIGMVGKSMPYRDRSGGSMPLTGDMFITNDAGVSWREVKKGPHLFEFGDHGGVIVLAHAEDYINHVW